MKGTDRGDLRAPLVLLLEEARENVSLLRFLGFGLLLR